MSGDVFNVCVMRPIYSVSPSSMKTAFFRQHGCSTNDTNAKYNSRAAQMYREKIRQQANAALSKYGTDVSVQHRFIRHIQTRFQTDFTSSLYRSKGVQSTALSCQ